MQGLISNRSATSGATYRYVVFLASLPWLVPMAALADSAACPANSTALECRMLGLLHWLEAAAWVLAILLVIVIGVAIHCFRKNRLSRKEGR